MRDNKVNKQYADSVELHRRKQAHREKEAKRPVSEKMAVVVRLRDFQRQLESIREANRAKREAKQIRIDIKTR